MRKRSILLGTLAVTVILAGFAFWLHINANHRSSSTSTASPAATQHHASMSETNIKLLEQSLNSPDIKQQAKALVIELRDDFLAKGQRMLPSGVSVKLMPDTYLVNHNVGQIEAVTSTGEVYVLHLVLENGTWLILYTEEKNQ